MCEESANSEKSITIRLRDFDIETSGDNIAGVKALHQGNSDIDIRMNGGSIKTDGQYAYGIFSDHYGVDKKGNIDIEVNGVEIETQGLAAKSIYGIHRIQGDLNIRLRGSTIKTDGTNAYGIQGTHSGVGDLKIDMRRSSIEVKNERSYAVLGRHEGEGKLQILARDLHVLTHKLGSHGILGMTLGNPTSKTRGTIIDVKGGSIETKAKNSYGIFGWHLGYSSSPNHNLRIIATDVPITTHGNNAHGIIAFHNQAGDIDIKVLGDTSVETKGNNSAPVYALHRDSGNSKISIFIDNGATLRATGENAHGIRAGYIDSQTMAITGAASVGADGYRQQVAVVNGQVTGGTGDAAGLYLAGGGKARIGGRVISDSGIAIHSARKLDTDPAPHLLVDFLPDGKRISSLIGDDWILNDGGGTTIAINGFVIHDKTNGVTGKWAPNGAWDVSIRKQGVKVTDRTSDDWTTETASGALDRDFSAEDFVRVRAARSAIYEVLPAFLLRLDEVVPEGGGNRLQSPNSELWLSVNNKFVSNAKRDGNIGTQCRSNLSSVGVGTDFSTTESDTGFIVGRMVHGEVRIKSPVGGGRIGATGVGIVTGITRQVSDEIYLKGQVSANRYNFSVRSSNYGSLGNRFGAWGLGYRAEVGQHFESNDETRKTARAWLDGKLLSLDRHIDAVKSNVSLKDGHELFVGVGLTAESVSYIGGSEQAVTWRGSIGVEVPIDGLTKVNLSGEPLSSKAPNTRLRFGFGADWRHGDINFNTAIEANGADARETAFQFRVGMKF